MVEAAVNFVVVLLHLSETCYPIQEDWEAGSWSEGSGMLLDISEFVLVAIVLFLFLQPCFDEIEAMYNTMTIFPADHTDDLVLPCTFTCCLHDLSSILPADGGPLASRESFTSFLWEQKGEDLALDAKNVAMSDNGNVVITSDSSS